MKNDVKFFIKGKEVTKYEVRCRAVWRVIIALYVSAITSLFANALSLCYTHTELNISFVFLSLLIVISAVSLNIQREKRALAFANLFANLIGCSFLGFFGVAHSKIAISFVIFYIVLKIFGTLIYKAYKELVE